MLDSRNLLYPYQSEPSAGSLRTISVIVSNLASALSARLRANASGIAGFFGEPYSSSP